MAVEFNADALIDKASALVQMHGQQAIDIAAGVERIKGIDQLTGIPGWGISLVGSIWAIKFLFKRTKEAQRHDTEGWHALGYLAMFVASLVGLLSLVSVLMAIFNVWAWVAIFDPKLALAHDILVKITGH